MSIFKVGPLDTEVLSLQTNPRVYFSSNSLGDITGTINVFPRQSHIIPLISEITASSLFDDSTQQSAYLKAVNDSNNLDNFQNSVEDYINILNSKKYQIGRAHV